MSIYKTASGTIIQLGAELGKGGEGTVHSIRNDASLAAKIYLSGLATERSDKISKMVAAKLQTSASFVAYPIDVVLDGKGVFCGFTMLKMPGRKPAHQLYGPNGRKTAFPKATFPMLVRATSNIARAMDSVHSKGCIIGDINHSGVLVADDATVVLIDTDSFQFSYGGRLYGCKVGVPEFTPPELQGKDLSSIVRTANHDDFGLAILIFCTLMMGRHPFAGSYLGQGDMPMDRAIAEYRFAYSSRRGSTLMEAPPNVPTLADLPLSLADAFERAFGPGGSAGPRVSASEWATLLDRAEGEIIPCTSSAAHHYFRSAQTCPWCRMERAYPGFQAFVPTFPIHAGGQPINLGQLIAAVRAVKDPGPAPELVTLMPTASSQKASASWAGVKKIRLRRWLGGIVGVILATYFLTLAPPGPLLGLLVMIISGIAGFTPPVAVRAERVKNKRAQTVWNDAKRAFEQGAGNSYFIHLRQEADKLVAQLQETNSEEIRRLAELTNRKRELQLRHYLDQHDIDQVKIKGIGAARKITLKSYGIETAADVDYARVLAISGFGPAIARSLVDWQQNVKSTFRFDPNLAIDPADVAAIKANIAAKRADLEAKARQTLSKLQKAASDAAAIRANPGSQATEAWLAWSNAQQFERELRPSAREVVKLAAVGSVGAVSLFSFSSLIVLAPHYIVERQKQSELATSTQPRAAEPTSSDSGRIPTQPGSSPQTAPSSPARQPGQPTHPSEEIPRLSEPSSGEGADGAKPVRAMPSGPGIETRLEPGTVAAPPSAVHNPLNRADAVWLQDRLRELGYYSGSSDGVWGLNSRAALRAFKTQNGLPTDDKWDAATEGKLLGVAQAGVYQTFEGDWARHAGDCGIGGDGAAPIRISQKGAQSKSANCEFQDVKREGNGWQVRGLCNAGGKRWAADIHLSMVGGVLTWSSERGTAMYFRCR